MAGKVFRWNLVQVSMISGCFVHEGSLRDVSFHDGNILVRRFQDGTFSNSCRFR